MLEKEVWQTRAGKLICLVIWLALAYIVLQYGMGLLLPFLFALAVAIPTSSLARHSQKRLGGNRRAWVYFYVFVFFGGILLFVGVIVGKAISEMLEFLEYISENKDELQAALDRIASFPKDLPLLNRISGIDVGGAGEYISGIAESIAKSMAQSGGETVMAALGAAVVSTPRMLISVVVAVLSSLYLALDYDEIKEYLYSLANEDKREGIERLARRIGKGVRGYLGAYGKLFLIIAAELYIGLLGLGRGYALLVALLIAALDILPFFGAGMVLIPWSVILFAGGSYGVGVGMLVLFGAVAVTRQIAEPRLVGKSIGIHPLSSLLSMYVGFSVFGFWGMVIAPVGVLVAKEIFEGTR